MSNNFKFKLRDKNLLDSKRIVLQTPCPVKGVKGFSSLHFFANNDNPGITVYTRDPSDRDKNFGRIQAKFGVYDMQILMTQLEQVVASKEPIKLDNTCFSVRGQDKHKAVSRVEVGKRPDGVVYIHVEDLEDSSRPKIYFPFSPTYWHKLGKNGEPLTEAEVSVVAARTFARMVSDLVTQISLMTYVHPEPKPQNQGGSNYSNSGNNGNYDRGNNNYQNNSGNFDSNTSFDADDDIPF